MTKSSKRKQPFVSLLQTMTVLAVLGVAAWFVLHTFFTEKAVVPMRVAVTLDNECGLVESAFMAVTDDGASALFDRGVAQLETRSGARVWVINSDKFEDFIFESDRVMAAPELTIAANCSPSGTAATTLDAFNKQFKSDKK